MIGLNEDGCLPETTLLFSPKGPLVQVLGLEHRPQQERMAVAVEESIEGASCLLIEAGTGVGKSLAYLIPGLLQAVREGGKLVVSTHTIALQEQLLNKDVPLCRRLFGASANLSGYADFKAAVLLGKSNYLCNRRLAHAVNETKKELGLDPDSREIARIAEWAEASPSGLVSELNPQPPVGVWEQVNADSPSCNSKQCSPETCSYRKARKAIDEAQLVILNHALLFSLLGAGMGVRQPNTPGTLFPFDTLVLDEAHTVPPIAANHLGLSLSLIGLRRQLLKIANPRKPKRKSVISGLLSPSVVSDIRFLLAETDIFFEKVRRERLSQRGSSRLTVPGWIENSLDQPLADLVHHLQDVENRIEEGFAQSEIQGLRRSLHAYQTGLNEAVQLADPQSVYWTEKQGVAGKNVLLRSAPLDVSQCLNNFFFSGRGPAIFTSATLAIGNSMDYFAGKVGGESARWQIEASPFDYDLQMKVCIAEDAPPPGKQNQQLDADYLSDQIAFTANRIQGGTLVLFRAFRDLQAVADRLGKNSHFDRPLLIHGSEFSRSHLCQIMRQKGNAVLLGTESFWTGVDIPGPALSQVIITRLPFGNPADPLSEAIADECRANGGHPFSEITLPEAVVAFRQGLGRLIRSATDSGWLTILDSRILQRPYGRLFIEALPTERIIRFNRQNRVSVFDENF